MVRQTAPHLLPARAGERLLLLLLPPGVRLSEVDVPSRPNNRRRRPRPRLSLPGVIVSVAAATEPGVRLPWPVHPGCPLSVKGGRHGSEVRDREGFGRPVLLPSQSRQRRDHPQQRAVHGQGQCQGRDRLGEGECAGRCALRAQDVGQRPALLRPQSHERGNAGAKPDVLVRGGHGEGDRVGQSERADGPRGGPHLTTSSGAGEPGAAPDRGRDTGFAQCHAPAGGRGGHGSAAAAVTTRNIVARRMNSLTAASVGRGIIRRGFGFMTLRFSILVERLFADVPWAVCPAESFSERFAELERRLRDAYPAEKGFGIRVSRKKDSWAVYVRKGPWSGVAVNCEPVYDAESFSPTRVSVWVGTYSRAVHLPLYLLVALVTSPVFVLLGKLLVPRLFANPVVLAAFWPLYGLAVTGLVLVLATFLGSAERFRHGEAHLDEVRALARSVLAADEQVLLPERVRARRFHCVLEWLAVGVGLIALGGGCWSLWEWWSYWDDPVNIEAARNGVSLETLQSARTIYLAFGAVLWLAAAMLVWGYALLRQHVTEERPSQSQPTAEGARRLEAGGLAGHRGK